MSDAKLTDLIRALIVFDASVNVDEIEAAREDLNFSELPLPPYESYYQLPLILYQINPNIRWIDCKYIFCNFSYDANAVSEFYLRKLRHPKLILSIRLDKQAEKWLFEFVRLYMLFSGFKLPPLFFGSSQEAYSKRFKEVFNCDSSFESVTLAHLSEEEIGTLVQSEMRIGSNALSKFIETNRV